MNVIEQEFDDIEGCFENNDKVSGQIILNELRKKYCAQSYTLEKIIEAEEVLAGRLIGSGFSAVIAIKDAIGMYESL